MESTETQETLPGLDLPGLGPEPATSTTALEAAVRATLSKRYAAGQLTDADAALNVLAMRLAQIIESKARSGRTSTVSNDARILKEILDDLKPEAGEVDDELKRAMEAWSE